MRVENLTSTAAILGMGQAEIPRKFDEIGNSITAKPAMQNPGLSFAGADVPENQ